MHPIALFVLAAAVQGQDFSWSGDLATGRLLSIRNISGDVRIEPASGRTVMVTAVRHAGRRGNPEDVEIRREETAEGLIFCVIYPSMRDRDGCTEEGRRNRRGRWDDDHDRNDTRVEFTVRLPAGVRLNAGTVSGTVEGRGMRAEVEATSVSGDVRLGDVTASLVEARSVSGDIELRNVQADEVGAETVSGDVAYSGAIRPRGAYDFKTLSGDIVLRVPRNIGAEVTASTFSGSFHSSFPVITGTSGRATRRQRVSGTIGDGSARIRLESFSGNVELLEGR
jgi:hypothetical protein